MVYLNGSLVIRSLTRGDNGQYSCNGTNSKGSVASPDVFVNVACKFKAAPHKHMLKEKSKQRSAVKCVT